MTFSLFFTLTLLRSPQETSANISRTTSWNVVSVTMASSITGWVLSTWTSMSKCDIMNSPRCLTGWNIGKRRKSARTQTANRWRASARSPFPGYRTTQPLWPKSQRQGSGTLIESASPEGARTTAWLRMSSLSYARNSYPAFPTSTP